MILSFSWTESLVVIGPTNGSICALKVNGTSIHPELSFIDTSPNSLLFNPHKNPERYLILSFSISQLGKLRLLKLTYLFPKLHLNKWQSCKWNSGLLIQNPMMAVCEPPTRNILLCPVVNLF